MGLKSGAQSQQPSKRDHGRVIRAQPWLGIFEFKSFARTCLAQLPSQFLIATDPTANRHKMDAVFPRCCNRLAHQDIDNRLLKRSAKISEKVALQVRQQIADSSFQSAKTKVL